jgi:hypothetical protein
LIKTSAALTEEGYSDDEFITHHSGSPHVFSVLQMILSHYLHNEFDTTNCDELTSEVLELLRSLVSFGFYSSHDKLNDILIPLLQVRSCL